MTAAQLSQQSLPTEKQLNPFERYLTIWVGLCMLAGIFLGKAGPGLIQALREMELGQDSHVNFPMAVLIWLMITPMMSSKIIG